MTEKYTAKTSKNPLPRCFSSFFSLCFFGTFLFLGSQKTHGLTLDQSSRLSSNYQQKPYGTDVLFVDPQNDELPAPSLHHDDLLKSGPKFLLGSSPSNPQQRSQNIPIKEYPKAKLSEQDKKPHQEEPIFPQSLVSQLPKTPTARTVLSYVGGSSSSGSSGGSAKSSSGESISSFSRRPSSSSRSSSGSSSRSSSKSSTKKKNASNKRVIKSSSSSSNKKKTIKKRK